MKAYKRTFDLHGKVAKSGCDRVGEEDKAVYGGTSYDSKMGYMTNI
jgi:hypothetical protein